jgi:hypothetical protein
VLDTINGLPVHPLVVHAVVVLLPLAALGVIAIAVLAIIIAAANLVQVYRVGDSGARAAWSNVGNAAPAAGR